LTPGHALRAAHRIGSDQSHSTSEGRGCEHAGPATAWIDGSGLIRRLELASEKGAAPFTMTMELTEFGKPVDVEEPAPDKVRELADVLDAQLR
jgi:hypothetical protein